MSPTARGLRAPRGRRARGRLPRSRGHVQRGGAAGRRRAGCGRAGGAEDDLRHDPRAHTRRGRVGARADRELAGRLDQRHPGSAGERGGRTADRRRGAAVGKTLADRRRAAGAGGDRDGPHPSAGPGQCERFLRGELGARDGAAGELDRRGGADGRRGRAAGAGGTGDGSGSRDLRRDSPAGGRRRTGTTTKRASCGSARTGAERVGARRRPPTRTRAHRPARRGRRSGRHRWCSGVRARTARDGSFAAWTSSEARDQPDEDRVAAQARSDGQLHVLRGPPGRGRAIRAIAEAVTGLQQICEQARVLGSYRMAALDETTTAAEPTADRPGAIATSRAHPRYTPALQMDSTVPPVAAEVRAATRAPAARA